MNVVNVPTLDETENQNIPSKEAVYEILEDCTPSVRNVVARNSILEIGNNLEFNGEIILLPNGHRDIPKAAKEVLNGIRTGDIRPTRILETDVEEKGKTRWCCGKIAILISFLLLTIGIIIVGVRESSSMEEKDVCGDFVSRSDWKADGPNCKLLKYERLPKLVVIYQTEKELCKSCQECVNQVKGLQKYQQKPRLLRATVRPAPACDIQYNFLVGGDGRIYEGRGFTVQGEMPDSFENMTFILAFMGTFVVTYPENIQLSNAEKFLEDASKNCYLDPDFRVAGAMDIRKSDSPGCRLNHQLKSWKRYTNDPLKLLNTSRTRNETNADLCYDPPSPPNVGPPYIH